MEILQHGLFLFLQVVRQRTVCDDGLHLFMDNFHESLLLLGIGIKLHEQTCTRARQTHYVTVRADAVRTSFALTDRLQVAGREDASDHLHIQVICHRERNVIRGILDAVGSRRGLHCAAEVVLLLTHRYGDMMVDHFFTVAFLGLHAAKPEADQLLHFRILRVDVSDKDKGEVRRVRKACLVNL